MRWIYRFGDLGAVAGEPIKDFVSGFGACCCSGCLFDSETVFRGNIVTAEGLGLLEEHDAGQCRSLTITRSGVTGAFLSVMIERSLKNTPAGVPRSGQGLLRSVGLLRWIHRFG